MSKEKFPGLEEIKRRAAVPKDQRKPRGRPKTRVYTPEELAKMPPSHRRRALHGRRTVPIMTAEGIVRFPQPSGKLTPALIEEIATKLVTGASGHAVAASCGVSPSTFAEWMSKGADPKFAGTLWAELVETVARSRAEWVVASAAVLSQGRKGWQGRAWLLERMFPEFAPPQRRLEHSGTGPGGSIRIMGSVEIPAEVPDGHPSLGAGKGAASPTPRGSASPRAARSAAPPASSGPGANGKHAVPILAEGSALPELPEEEDPD